jgi:hypothetical protein
MSPERKSRSRPRSRALWALNWVLRRSVEVSTAPSSESSPLSAPSLSCARGGGGERAGLSELRDRGREGVEEGLQGVGRPRRGLKGVREGRRAGVGAVALGVLSKVRLSG